MSFTRFIACFDLHGDRQDYETVKAFLDFDKEWKPQIRIFGGDLVDLRPLRKGASADERRESIRADIDAGKAFLKAFKPDYWILGNHDFRLWDSAEACDGPVSDIAQMGVNDFTATCQRLKTKMLPYHKRDNVLKIGHAKWIHGFYCGKFAAKQHAEVYGSCMFGHTHTIDEHPIPGLERRVARGCGCLCLLDMDYNNRQPNSLRQAHGWIYGVINEKTGAYFCFQAEKIDGIWLLPTNLKQIG